MQDKSPFYTYLMKLVMDPEYMKECVDTQNRISAGADGAHGLANRVRKAQLSVCCRYYAVRFLFMSLSLVYYILCHYLIFRGILLFSPVDTFLTLMNSDISCWPNKGSFKVSR